MNQKITAGIVVVLLLVGAAYWYTSQKPAPATSDTTVADSGFGTYMYECDEHVGFTMSPASDMSTIHVKASGNGSYPPESTLTKVQGAVGARYEGNGVVFVGAGEEVTLGEGDSRINCSPVSNPDEAPFNFGDAGEGGPRS